MSKKEGSGGGVFGPVTEKARPLSFGSPDNEPLRKVNSGEGHSQPKEEASGCPHPAAKQEEGPAGRGEQEHLSVKEGHFNRERARSTGMRSK